MFRIDTSTAVDDLPAPSPAGAPGFFSGGNLGTGTPPTTVSPDWFNTVQEELISLLVAGDIAPSKIANNQVLLALQAIFQVQITQSAGSLVIEFPGGLVIQLGHGSQTDNSGAQVIDLPQALSSPPFWSIAGNSAGAPPTAFHGTANTSDGSITVFSSSTAGTPAPAGVAFNWAAAGFR